MLDPARLEQIAAACRRAPCIESLGLKLLEADEGYVKLSARRDPRFDGLLPGFHGGMLANVADCAAWYAVVTRADPAEPLVTTDLHVRYLAPCLTDVVAVARLLKFGKTLCPVTVEMFDAQAQLVAVADISYFRVGALRA